MENGKKFKLLENDIIQQNITFWSIIFVEFIRRHPDLHV